jgi:hypothetical protein
MVIDAIDALSNADTVLAGQIVATDARLDALQREIENLAVTTIARSIVELQPEGDVEGETDRGPQTQPEQQRWHGGGCCIDQSS